MNLSITYNLTTELVVSTLLSKETRTKSGLGSPRDVKMVRGRSIAQGYSGEISLIQVKRKGEHEVLALL